MTAALLRHRGASLGADRAQIEIAPEDMATVGLFMALGTQWKWHPMGPRIGLDYGAIGPAATAMGIDLTPQVFGDLRTMELAALAAWSKR